MASRQVLPLLFSRPSTAGVVVSLAAAAENTVPRPPPLVFFVRACSSNVPSSMVTMVYSPSPLNVNDLLSRVTKCGSPHIKAGTKRKGVRVLNSELIGQFYAEGNWANFFVKSRVRSAK